MKKIIHLGALFLVFCVVFGALVASVYIATKPQIEQNAKDNLKASLKEVLPQATTFKRSDINSKEAYIGNKNTTKVGYILLQDPNGYSGNIEMLIGIDAKSAVAGVKILSHTETPGLGANIVNKSFLDQFLGKTVKDDISVKSDIHALTGATISSKAVCVGVKKALKEIE